MINKAKNIIFHWVYHYLIYFLSAISFAYFLDLSMLDDGLRHIAFAQNQDIMKSWGEVFPHSLFSSYDPWFLWHYLLKFFLFFIPYESLHIVINSLALFLLMALIDSLIRKYVDYNYSALLYVLVFGIVFIVFPRYVMVRPDFLSGLFVLFALQLRNKFLLSFFITLIYAPFYYLFFMYTGAIGLVFLIQKKWHSFLGVFLASLLTLGFFLIHDFQAYTQTIFNILNDQNLRMGIQVGEGKPLFEIFSKISYFILLPSFLFTSFFIIYKYYNYFINNSLALFILISSILWVNQLRYFYLLLPLFIIFFLSVFVQINKKKFFKTLRKYYILLLRSVSFSKKEKIFYLIAIPYAIVAFSYFYHNTSLNKEVEKGKMFKEEFFTNKTILSNKLSIDMYKALYYNPTLKFIPSCSVGWFEDNEEMKKIYIQMQKKEGVSEAELFALINYVNADIYIHYLRNEKQILSFEKLREYGIIPKFIYQNKIVFTIKRDKK